jgi:hypothetical protein
MKPKRLSSFPNLTHQKRSFLFGQILDQIKNKLFSTRQIRNDTKTFWFRFQNNFGMFVLFVFYYRRHLVLNTDGNTAKLFWGVLCLTFYLLFILGHRFYTLPGGGVSRQCSVTSVMYAERDKTQRKERLNGRVTPREVDFMCKVLDR